MKNYKGETQPERHANSADISPEPERHAISAGVQHNHDSDA